MEMDQLQAILHIFLFQKIERFQQLTGSQAEFAGITTAIFPFATSRRSQLDADTYIGAHIELFRHLGYQAQFVHFLHHQEDAFSHLLCQQSQFNIALILISVTDNQRIRVRVYSNHRMELRLGTGFQPQIEFLAMTDDFFYHRTHLIHLDGVNDKVLGLVAILIRCLLEAVRNLFNTIIQNIRKTEQHRCCHIP